MRGININNEGDYKNIYSAQKGKVLALAGVVLLCLTSVTSADGTIFEDDFSTDKGWAYDTNQERGSATASTGHNYGYPDPANDHTDTADNYLIGTVIGGNVGGSEPVHDYYYVTSPVIDCGSKQEIKLSFYRYSSFTTFGNKVFNITVWNGESWVQIWKADNSQGPNDDSWKYCEYDVSAYADLNSNFRVRFGYKVISSPGETICGWNIDDVKVFSMSGLATPWEKISIGGGSTPRCLMDIDNDGFVDALTLTHWYKNPGDGTGNWTSYSIGNDDYTNIAGRSRRIGDVNGDGLPDLVIGVGRNYPYPDRNGIYAFINPGDTGTWDRYLIGELPDAPDGVETVAIGDVNKDGYSDIFAGGECSELRLFLNPGYMTDDWNNYLIYNSGTKDVEGLVIKDFNNDGWLDIASTFCHPYGLVGETSVFINPKVDYGAWTKTTLTTVHYSCIESIAAGDIDGDGWEDVVSSPWAGQKLYWYKNPQGPGAWTEYTIDGSAYLAPEVADIDLDGKLDIIWHNGTQNTTYWYKKDGEDWIRNVIHSNNISRNYAVGDVDNDGDPDIICNGYWYVNPFVPLSYETGFEPEEGFSLGYLHNQNGWEVTDGTAAVQSDTVYTGTQAVTVSGEIHRFLAGANGGIRWIDLYFQPVGGSPQLPSISQASVFYFDFSQGIMCYDGAGDGTGEWVSTGVSVSSNTWYRISIKQDYTAQTWEVYVDSDPTPKLSNLGFKDSLTSLNNFSMANPGYLDDLYFGSADALDRDEDGLPDSWEQQIIDADPSDDINSIEDVNPGDDFDGDGLTNLGEYENSTDPTNPDTDSDGMPDGWEVDNGLNPLVDDASLDPDGDGYTNLQEYQQGTHPQYYTHSLPYETAFEPEEGFVLGDLDNQNGWQVADGTAEVETDIVHSGTQAVTVFSGEVRKSFGGTNNGIQWIDLYLQPIVGPSPAGLTPSSSLIYFDATQGIMCYDGNGDGTGEWVSTGVSVSSNTWYRISIKQDYTAQTWEVYIDSDPTPKLSNLGFKNSLTSLNNFFMANSGYLDDLYLAPDTDSDGLPDSWEQQIIDADPGDDINSIEDVNPGDDFDGDGLTNLGEYDHGTDPTEPDTDSDGMPDGWEVDNGLNPLVDDDASLDPDDDGYTNLQEYRNSTDPHSFDAESLPYETGFEPEEGFVLGNLDAQNGWRVTEGTAQVETNTVHSGTQAVTVSSGEVRKSFGGTNNGIQWIDLYLQPIVGPSPAGLTPSSSLIYFDATQGIMCYDGNGDGTGEWVAAGVSINPDTWYRITIRQDYDNSTWTCYVDDEICLEDLGFKDNSRNSFNLFQISSLSSPPVYLDDLYFGSDIFDRDEDGLPDSWEQQIIDADPGDGINSIEDVNPGDDFDADGQSNNSECVAGTDPTSASSLFKIAEAKQNDDNTNYLDISWTFVEGKTYTIHYSNDAYSNAMDWHMVDSPTILTNATTLTWTDDGTKTGGIPPGEVNHRYYKVKVE